MFLLYCFQCDMAVATKFFFDMVDSNNTMVMVFGDACSSVSGPIAEISKEWNVWLVSTFHFILYLWLYNSRVNRMQDRYCCIEIM